MQREAVGDERPDVHPAATHVVDSKRETAVGNVITLLQKRELLGTFDNIQKNTGPEFYIS